MGVNWRGEGKLTADLHIHSKYSYDSVMEPRKILELYRNRGYDLVSITDHNTIRGSVEAKKYEEEFDIEVIVGEEVRTDVGDIIALNLSREITSRSFPEVLQEINSQGAVSILPHPYKGHNNVEDIANKVDLIEVWNSRASPEENAKAYNLALTLGKPPIAGSDAHIYREIGNSFTFFSGILDYDKAFEIRYAGRYEKVCSYIMRDMKLREFHRIPFHLLRLVF